MIPVLIHRKKPENSWKKLSKKAGEWIESFNISREK
jgi:hypothetical protein